MKRTAQSSVAPLLAFAALVLAPHRAQAQVEMVQVTVPAGVSFSVTDVATTTMGSPTPTTITFAAGTWPPPNGRKLKVSIRAESAAFTPPSGASIPASSVSWTATASNGTPSDGTMSSSAYQEIYRSQANTPAGSFSLTWRLGALNSISGLRAGNHTLTVRWRFELM